MLPISPATTPERSHLRGASGLSSRRNSPLRPAFAGSPSRCSPLTGSPIRAMSTTTSLMANSYGNSPLRRARRSLRYEARSSTISRTECALCLLALLCFFVFFTLYDGQDSAAPRGKDPTIQTLKMQKRAGAIWRGNNISAYENDAYSQHWEGKRCERSLVGEGVLPKLLVIGSHKGGSSALFEYLAMHGSVRPSFCKEAHFFDWKYNIVRREMGLSNGDQESSAHIDKLRMAYGRFFRTHSPGRPQFMSIEGTPSYFHSPEVAARVKLILPDVQLAVSLRNPMDRAISHFMGQKSRDFRRFRSCSSWFDEYAVLAKRCDPLRPINQGFGGAPKLPLSPEVKDSWQKYANCVLDGDNPVARGIYAPQLFTWLQHFTPGQLHIIQSDNLFKDPAAEVARLVSRVGLRPHYTHEEKSFEIVGSRNMERFNSQYVRSNTGVKQAAFKKVFDCDKSQIHKFYAKYESDLFDLLQAYFPHEIKRWQKWSQMQSPGLITGKAAHQQLQDAGIVLRV